MAMRFKYTPVPFRQPAISLGGRLTRPWPMVMVGVEGPLTTMPADLKIDSACDDTLLSEKLATTIGVDLTNAPTGTVVTANQGIIPVRFGRVVLRLSDGIEFRAWPAWVGFAPRLHRPLAGFGGFMQFFKTTFFGDLEEFELEVNSLYPGT